MIENLGGDTEKARVEYLKLRVQSIKDEMVLKDAMEQEALEEEANRKKKALKEEASRQKKEAENQKASKARQKEFQRMAFDSFKKLHR